MCINVIGHTVGSQLQNNLYKMFALMGVLVVASVSLNMEIAVILLREISSATGLCALCGISGKQLVIFRPLE